MVMIGKEVVEVQSAFLEGLRGVVDRGIWERASAGDEVPVVWKGESDSAIVCKENLRLIFDGVVPGVGPDAETITHPNGAKESKAEFAATSLPPKALLAVAAVQKLGDDKYGVDNWRDIPVRDHLNHAQIHYLAHMAGDKQDKHLEHYATRALMALELYLEQNGGIR